MNKVEIAVDIAADAGRVWEALADFGAFLDWAGGGQGEIRIEGEGIGMARHLELPGAVKLAERLTRRDVESRTLAYELAHGAPLGMVRYQAEVRVEATPKGATLHWRGEFEARPPAQQADVASALENAYRGMSSALETYVNSGH